MIARNVTLLVLLCSAACIALPAREANAAGAGRAAAHGRPALEVGSVLRLKPNSAHGRELFRTCAVCHGATDAGLPKGWVPEIAGQYVRVIVKQLVDFRDGRRWDLRMEIIAGRHVLKSRQDIVDVATYAASLTPAPPPAVGSGENAVRGEVLYESRCVVCHGRGAEGSNARFVPRLAGQDYDYLLRQLHDAIDGRRPGLKATHAKLLRPFDAADLEGLADYLSRLGVKAQGARS